MSLLQNSRRILYFGFHDKTWPEGVALWWDVDFSLAGRLIGRCDVGSDFGETVYQFCRRHTNEDSRYTFESDVRTHWKVSEGPPKIYYRGEESAWSSPTFATYVVVDRNPLKVYIALSRGVWLQTPEEKKEQKIRTGIRRLRQRSFHGFQAIAKKCQSWRRLLTDRSEKGPFNKLGPGRQTTFLRDLVGSEVSIEMKGLDGKQLIKNGILHGTDRRKGFVRIEETGAFARIPRKKYSPELAV